MLERPDLADAKIIEQLQADYGLRIRGLDFMPIGNDQRAWSYRVETETGVYFLKLRKGGTKPASLIAPHHLKTQGIEQVVAPLETVSGMLSASHGDYDLILYPFVVGKSAWRMPIALSQWRAWGAVMRKIHGSSLSVQVLDVAEHEVFGVKWLNTIDKVEDVLRRGDFRGEDVLRRGDFRGEVAAEAARVWRDRSSEIQRCRRRFREAGALLAADPPGFVLCHADIHTANIILNPRGEIRIVDWDETVIAPKERDLMFFVEDGHKPEETEAFFTGYDGGEINWLALAYYKYDWVVQEFGDYGERIFLSDEIGVKDLESALFEFKRLFEPDDVIDRAHRTFQRMMCQPAFSHIGIG